MEPNSPRYGSTHPGLVVWFTGLSSAGKTTLSTAAFDRLGAMGYRVEHLDGDAARHNISKGLGFSREDRDENIRRIGFLAAALERQGVIVLVSAISPHRDIRNEIRAGIGRGFLEVFVNAPLDVCEARDVKGLYRKARAGLLRDFTGLDAPYEAPCNAEIECRTDIETVTESVSKVVEFVLHWLEGLAA
jgi:adenylylsulfate kinase